VSLSLMTVHSFVGRDRERQRQRERERQRQRQRQRGHMMGKFISVFSEDEFEPHRSHEAMERVERQEARSNQ
jgi:hypothetical protein